MCRRFTISILIMVLFGLTRDMAAYADISGRVLDREGSPIERATVTLVSNGAKTTTGADGRYTLTTAGVKSVPALQSQVERVTVHNGFLNFSMHKAASLKYEIFDVKGNLLAKKEMTRVLKGVHRFRIAEKSGSTSFLVIRASVSSKEMVFNCLKMNGRYVVCSNKRHSSPVGSGVAKTTAVNDTIKVAAEGYKEQVIAITSYEREVNVTMKTVSGNDCGEFTLISDEVSTAIPTVGIIEWAYSEKVSKAHIEFGLKGDTTVMEAPVDIKESNYRTLLLGMKQKNDYVFRIVVETGSGTCVSDDYPITTGSLVNAPEITKSASGASSMTGGFIVTTTGNGLSMKGGSSRRPMAVIFDMDGDVVWAASAPRATSRARMSWDGRDMWVNASNNMGSITTGEMRRISMDGLDVEKNVKGLSAAHHDFTVTPDNEIVTIAFGIAGKGQILVRSANGEVNALVADISTLYKPVGDCHPNYIQYYEFDEGCFTLADRNTNMIVKFRCDGTLLWQFGGSNPRGKSFSVSESWLVNHGHELEEDGRLLLFNNGGYMGGVTGLVGGLTTIAEYKLDESGMTASKSWEKSAGRSSLSLGDVQRLPDDHVLVTVSNAGRMDELDSLQKVVLSFAASEFGYSEFRESLYGPPLDY